MHEVAPNAVSIADAIETIVFSPPFVMSSDLPPLVMSSVVETSLSEIYEISPLTTFGRDDRVGEGTFGRDDGVGEGTFGRDDRVGEGTLSRHDKVDC